MKKIIDYSHFLIQSHVNKDDIFLDMTLGNGNDTLFACKYAKEVIGFDIQEKAIENSKKILEDNNVNNYKLILDSHFNFEKYLGNNKVGGAIFNLGYLPNGNKNITTKAEITLQTIQKLLPYLNKNKIIIIVCYPGHQEGLKEANLLFNYLKDLKQEEFNVLRYEYINQINKPPFILAIERR